MATNVHMTHIEDTWANWLANGDHGQIGITNDTPAGLPYDEFVWLNDDVTKSYVAAAQKYWSGAAWTYLDADFDKLTSQDTTDGILTAKWFRHLDDTDTNIQMHDDTDRIVITAGGVDFLDLIETAQDVFEVNPGNMDIDTTINTTVADTVFAEGSSGDVYIRKAYSGGTPLAGASQFVVEFSGANSGMSLLVSAGNDVRFVLADANDNDFFYFLVNTGAQTTQLWQEGQRRIDITATETIFNQGQLDLDFRVETNNQAHMIFAEGSTDRVGINESAPGSTLHVTEDDSATNTVTDILTLSHTTDQAAVTGFGTGLVFTLTDSSITDGVLGQIRAVVGSADTEGDLVFLAGTNGAEEMVRITQAGALLVNTAIETGVINAVPLTGDAIFLLKATAGNDTFLHLVTDTETWFVENDEADSNHLKFIASTGKANCWFTTTGELFLGNDDLTWSANQETAFGIVDATYARFRQTITDSGGLQISGFAKTIAGQGRSIELVGYTENDPADEGCVHVRTYKHDGAGALANVGATATVFAIENNVTQLFEVDGAGDVHLLAIKSGATQGGAGAAANELWKTASHATLPDNVIMIGV